MRGTVQRQDVMFHTFKLEDKIPADHPLRAIKKLADEALQRMAPDFRAAYSGMGRPSIPPEQLLKACILQALFSIPSERQLCEQLGYNLLFQWFLDLAPDAPVWEHSTLSKNRARFSDHGLMRSFFEGSVRRAIETAATDKEHFSVDGTLIQSWASMKSVKRKDDDTPYDGNAHADFHGEKRRNETHESKTDPEARLFRKGSGREALLSHSLHILTENAKGLVMDMEMEEANGRAERVAAKRMMKRFRKGHGRKVKPKSLAADKGYDDGKFLREMEDLGIAPQVAIRGCIAADTEDANARRRALARRGSTAYALAQKARRLAEPFFGWGKAIGGLRRTRFRQRWYGHGGVCGRGGVQFPATGRPGSGVGASAARRAIKLSSA